MSEFIKQVNIKKENARLCRIFCHFFTMSLINSVIQKHKG